MAIASSQPLASRCSLTGGICSCSFLTSSLAAPPFQLKLPSSTAAPRSALRLQCSFGPSRGAGASGVRRRTVIIGGTVCASSSEAAEVTSTGVAAETWLLQPIGDGDSRHIGFKVAMPSAYEIVSNEVTVGRVPERADMVIPVATVSGLHARIEKKGGNLFVTDLDSTNGTFINEKRLTPGVASPASPGNRITFGDTHLAIFLVSKLEAAETTAKPQESEEKLEREGANRRAESAS